MRRSTRVRKAKRSQGATRVSLFPFLAVLICTVGALVLLLVVVSRQARVQAARVAAQQASKEHAGAEKKLQEDRADVQWRIGHLRDALAATKQQLTDARLTLGHVEEHTRELREQLKQLEIADRELERAGADTQQQAALKNRLDDISAKIAQMKSRVDQARREALGQRPRSYAIVPYTGPNGTRRRPIYIECRSDAVVLRPEGIVFGPADFMGSLGPDNPLAAALRATREYLLEAGRFDPSKSGEPYPLLLVRPSGVASYEAARTAMSSWESEFGYELIDEDWDLEFEPPDPKLAQLLDREIARARMRTELLARAAPQHYAAAAGRPGGLGGRTEYTVSSTSGVVVPYGGEPVDDTPRRRWRGGDRPSFSESDEGSGSDRATADNARAASRGDSLASAGDGTGSEPGDGYRAAFGSTGSNGGEPGQGGGGPSQYEAGGSTEVATLPLLGKPAGNPYGGSSGTMAEGPYGNGDGPSLGSPSGSANTGSSGLANGNTSESPFGRSPGNASDHARTGAYADTPGGAAGNSPNLSQNMPGGSRGDASSLAAGSMRNSSGNTANGATSCPAGGANGSSGMMPPADPGATTGSEGMTLPPMLGARSSPSGPTSSGASDSPLRLGEWDPNRGEATQGPAGPQASGRASSHQPPPSIAAQRGRDWAVPEVSPQSTPLTKPIRIECHGDRLILVAERGLAGGRSIDLGPRTRDAMEDLTSAIWDYTESWGIAGKGMYWRPILHVYVAPGAESRYADLEALLRDSGLLIKRKQ